MHGVVGACDGFVGNHGLHSNELEALAFEAVEDFTDQAALDTVGLDHDVRGLHGFHLTRRPSRPSRSILWPVAHWMPPFT